jgi:HTH-type transcriptional repressor of NAD biosynthesis genes
MNKKYKSCFYSRQFLPLHKGHLHLIDTALNLSEKVTLLVCSIKSEPIPGEVRFRWVKENLLK